MSSSAAYARSCEGMKSAGTPSPTMSRSIPVPNDRPAPRSSTTRTSGSAPTAATAASSAWLWARSAALSFSGRLNVIVATGPSTSRSTGPAVMTPPIQTPAIWRS